MSKVVVVESPAKAKTINKYLGSDFKVLASYGHVRNLPQKNGSIDVSNNFQATWEIDSKSKKHIDAIVKALKDSNRLILATDPDREGEAISWHLLEILKKKKAIKDHTVVERVVFNAVTKNAILNAMNTPREIDIDLVEAYLARNSLDYLMGFNISPVLWRRLPGGPKSAGRVQSPALKLVVDREMEIEKFKKEEFWSINSKFQSKERKDFEATLNYYNGEKVEKFSFKDEESASDVLRNLEGEQYFIKKVESKNKKRNPYAPFTTSTLQQNASNALRISPRDVMSIAQKLYEAGLITYMRTDGIEMAPEGITGARKQIASLYGNDFVPEKPIFYKNKAKNAQEAHECIRPTDFSKLPENVEKLSKDELNLYSLIWRRAMASQARAAEVLQTTILISSMCEEHSFRASGQILIFEGHLKVYKDSKKEDDEKHLPNVKESENALLKSLEKQQHFTEPPPRFNEASLIKRLEEEGIGRPSTYASIISKIQDKNYVKKEKNKLIPEDTGRILNVFLEAYFNQYIKYDYTAKLEEHLDEISNGQKKWLDVLNNFWRELSNSVEFAMSFRITEVLATLEEKLTPHLFVDKNGKQNTVCSLCGNGKLSLKLSKTGAFIGCSSYPSCTYARPLNSDPNDSSLDLQGSDKVLGETSDGKKILVKTGRYGPYLEIENQDQKKPKRASIPKHYSVEELSLEKALQLISLPKNLGDHPNDGKEVIAAIGPYGPYIKHGSIYANIKDFEEIFSIGMNRAVELLSEAEKRKPGKGSRGKELRDLGNHPEGERVKIMSGRYGDYIKWNKTNVTIPKDHKVENITLDQAIELISSKRKK